MLEQFQQRAGAVRLEFGMDTSPHSVILGLEPRIHAATSHAFGSAWDMTDESCETFNNGESSTLSHSP
ncbi:hypothetical protein GGI64_000975 [Rhizobium leguminosarum]|uniref:Uncharacterized protein n=1 Tax=Rhizobium leguminosarum TaxID=384 RepID=A0A7Z0DV72_RHILE|nr:hypothetical protein [Rhizobium leguminosarum]